MVTQMPGRTIAPHANNHWILKSTQYTPISWLVDCQVALFHVKCTMQNQKNKIKAVIEIQNGEVEKLNYNIL